MDALFSDYDEISKSGLFDADYYLATYPDVGERNVDPLVHYLEEGAPEGRNPSPGFDSAFYLEQCRLRGEHPSNPLTHYLRVGAARGFKICPDEAPPPRAGRRRRIPEALRRQPVLLAIELLAASGMQDGSSRLSLGGWALAATPISEIAVTLNGDVVGTATYGLARPDVARLYPDRAGADRCGFVLAFDLPEGTQGVIEPVLTVLTDDGETGQRLLRVEIPPQQRGLPIVDPLAGPGGVVHGAEPRAMQLYIDTAMVDAAGILAVEGWVVCLVQIEAVEVFIDGAAIGTAEFGRVRADVETLQPNYPNSRFSGFRLVADVGAGGAGHKTITIRARARDGVSGEARAEIEVPAMAAGRPPATPVPFRYHCDEIALTTTGRLQLKGWAVGPSPVAALAVLLDGEEVGAAEIGLDRPDIGNLFPGIAHARRPGFALTLDTGRNVAGAHLVTLLFRRADGAIDDATIPVIVSEARAAPQSATGALPATAGNADRRLQLDLPVLSDGAVETPVRGNLEIAGWALARAGVDTIEIAIDGAPVAVADYGLRRLDIQAAFPDWADALGSGYQALVPHRALPKGGHLVSVVMRDRTGMTATAEFRMVVEDAPEGPGPWSLRRKMRQAEIDLGHDMLERCGWRPTFAAILPVDGDAASLQRAQVTLRSLQGQAYANWRLTVVSRKSLAPERLCAVPALAERVRVVKQLAIADLADIGAAANETFVMILAPGDELGVDAFLELAIAGALDPDADFLYGDERRHNPASGKIEAFFKPQWSPDLLLSTNYIGRVWCVRAALLAAVAEPGERLPGHGEYDLVLRITEGARAIRHVPAVLCERAAAEEGAARQSKAALQRLVIRRGIAAAIEEGAVEGTYRLRRALTRPGLVSIIIPTCAALGLVEKCITTLRALTAYRDYEIVCVENIPAKDRKWRQWLRHNADRVIAAKGAFNWSRFNNLAAAAAQGEYLLFLNDDVEIVDPLWLDTLVAEAQRPEVGVVGPQLLYPDGRVQHAGMFLAALGQARHAFRYAAADDPGYFGLALTQRNVSAVTGACFLTRRETFSALGGFDEAHGIINNDVDYCLRASAAGLFNLYTPHARLVHHEAISRAALDDAYDFAVFEGKWRGVFVAGDPFFSPHLSKAHDDFVIDDEPTERSIAGGPVLSREVIRHILVVKLDHIGDCITAFPAVRRLKRQFPLARIAVLTSRASQPVWAFEPAVDQTIEFDFFHARSALGALARTDADWLALRERLAGEHFDLAVDLRKHLETRPVLQHTGARILAGFDHRNQFPWLDIALEWGGDHLLAKKRQWAGDDLVNLIDAIAAACENDRAVIALPAAAAPAGQAAGPVVWVHPTSGNDIKQWPLEYFAVVIDRLVEAHGARIVLTGASGDEAAAERLVGHLRHAEAVTSMIGRSPLARLPELMEGAALFLGTDSGVKHIAAGLGVPTVAVHGGTLDPLEWGGVGPAAVMVARNVICSPCYLARIEDCRRGVACLRQLEPGAVYEACRRLLLLGNRR